jgi:hypothetical protein
MAAGAAGGAEVQFLDFYNERTDQHLPLEGRPGQPEGAVTIQGAKMHVLSREPVIDIRGYAEGSA